MSKKKFIVNKAHSDTNKSLTMIAFEQLLAHYRKTVWEIKIAPTLVSSESLAGLLL
jgi:hypothetical protein